METNGTQRQVIREMSGDTRLLLQRLLESKPGEELTYEILSAVISRDVHPGAKGYSNLASARRSAGSEGVIFGTIPKVGLRRLDDQEIAATGGWYIQKTHRAARKGAKVLLAVKEPEKMPVEKRTQYNLNLSVLGALMHISSTKAAKKLEARVAESGKSLPLARTLEECNKS